MSVSTMSTKIKMIQLFAKSLRSAPRAVQEDGGGGQGPRAHREIIPALPEGAFAAASSFCRSIHLFLKASLPICFEPFGSI